MEGFLNENMKNENITADHSNNEIKETGNSENILKRQDITIILGSLLLGILFNILFYKKSLGISYPIFVMAFYGVLMWVFRGRIKYRLGFAGFMGLAVLLLSLTYLIFSNPIFRVLNFLAVPIVLIIQTILMTEANMYKWHSIRFLYDIANGIFVRTLSHVFKPFRMVSKQAQKRTNPHQYVLAGKVLIGILLSLPLLCIVVVLLSSADDIFRHWVEIIPDFLEALSIGDLIAQLIILLIVGSVAFSYLWSLFYEKKAQNTAVDEPFNRFIDPVILITVLVMLNLIYVVFTFLQFAYLFGAAGKILPPDVTYSEYARRGFFELIFVTLINLGLLIGGINFARKESSILERILKVLYLLLIGCTMVMLLSAHFRMSFYEMAYGFTHLRVLTHAFMVFIFLLLVAASVKVLCEQISLMKLYIVIAVSSYVIVNYINIDAIIAKNNMKREKLDARYLTTLSYDAVPYMVDLLEYEDEAVAQEIENHLYIIKQELEEKNDWQSFNISKFIAKKTLSEKHLKYEALSR